MMMAVPAYLNFLIKREEEKEIEDFRVWQPRIMTKL